MPLFIFISGRFSHINNRRRYKVRILRLLETYIFFQLISSIIMIIKGDNFSFQYFYVPNWILWYLVSLIYWRLMVYFIPGNWLKHQGTIIVLSFSISLLAGFIPIGRSVSFQKSLAYLPFFVLGYYSSEINIKSIINRISPYFALGSLLLVFAFLFVFVDENLKYIIHYNMFYWSENFVNTILNFIARGVSLSFAVVLGLMVMRLCPSNNILSKWGNKTLFIYIYHGFILKEILFPMVRNNFLPQNEF